LQVHLFFIVISHKDGGKQIDHSLLTGKLVSRFSTHHQSCKCKTNLIQIESGRQRLSQPKNFWGDQNVWF